MGSAFHQLCPRYSGTLTPTAPTAIRLWDTFTFTLYNNQLKFSSLSITTMGFLHIQLGVKGRNIPFDFADFDSNFELLYWLKIF